MNAQLKILVGERKGYPFLKQAYFTTPFKVANITASRTDACLQLVLMSSSPGILEGDKYEMEIAVEKNCALQLHTQAYQRLFDMKEGATQQMNVRIGERASFVFLPHPCVPHERSVFTSRNNFYLGRHCHFVFGEVLTCGRKLNGETFLFSKYQSITRVFMNDRLVIKENLLVQPSLVNVNSIGQLEGYTHQASLIFLDDNADVKTLQATVTEFLAKEKNIEYGITAAPVNGLIIRLLGHGAEQLHKLLIGINDLIESNRKDAKPQRETHPGVSTA